MSADSYRLISYRLSVIGYQLSVIGYQLSVNTNSYRVIGLGTLARQQTTDNRQRTTDNRQQTTDNPYPNILPE